MTSIIDRLNHAIEAIIYFARSTIGLTNSQLMVSKDLNINSFSQLKVYTYKLPQKYSTNHLLDLKIVYDTYLAHADFFKNVISTDNPLEADYFFVPIFLHKFQYLNQDPKEVLKYLTYLSPKKNHLIVSTGDFSQRAGNNHFGNAYKKKFSWLNNFKLIALESTDDLLSGQDIGSIPYNALVDNPVFNTNKRTFLYSFLGETNHEYLPKTHIRNKLRDIPMNKDTYIGSTIDSELRNKLKRSYNTSNDYELLSRNSTFTLCPAGYGRWTYRLFQSITWGSIPVLLSDHYVLPFANTINYADFCIKIYESDIQKADKILRSFSKAKIEMMQNALKDAQKYFTNQRYFEMLYMELRNHKVDNI